MKILYIITELHEGGAENVLARVGSELAERGWDLHVAALFGAGGPPGERLRAAGIPVTDLGIAKFAFPHAPKRVRALAARVRPDLVHSWLFHANLAAKLGLPGRTPLVCGLRVAEPRRLHVWLERLTRRRARLYACVSRAVAEFAERRLRIPRSALRVIGNGVDRPGDAPGARPRDRLSGLTVARITRQKGLDVLLKALARLPEALPWEWKIVGSAPEPGYAAFLEDTARRLGLSGRVHWLGPAPRSEIAVHYQNANLFVLSSRWEGQPNALLEAVAWGLPAVASAVDGIRDLAREAPGCIATVPPEHPAALAAAIAAQFTQAPGGGDPRACARLLELHSWPRIIAEWESLYREIPLLRG